MGPLQAGRGWRDSNGFKRFTVPIIQARTVRKR